MIKHFICAALACTALSGAARSASDPVLMNIAGKNVPLSEFEYLYHKNNNQQMEPLSPERYLQMFIDYKLKVAAAEAAGLDTTATFRSEYMQYRDELAKPYMRVAAVEDSLVAEAFSHYAEAVEVSHIMLPPAAASREKLDSVRAAILAGSETFENAARRISVDGRSARMGGKMGNVTPGRFPWAFEKASYDTPQGQISRPVNSGFGWHIIRVDSRRPAEGEVNAAHILLMTQNATPAQAEQAKATIDSLYAVAAAGADFAELAKHYSQDPGSARNGGDLGWFGRGVMVQPFDSISFALPDGGLSKPFETPFGWHIIYKKASRKDRSLDEMRPEIERAMSRDERADAAVRAYTAQAVASRNGRIDRATLAAAQAAVDAAADGAPLDSLLASPALGSMKAFALGKTASATLADIAPRVAGVVVGPEAKEAVEKAMLAALDDAALDDARAELMANNADYRNLMNEYRDGILLFEIANEKVWDRASRDTEGLNAFFEAHRADYTWDTPHFKSYVIFASTEEKLAEAMAEAAKLDPADPEAFNAAMREKFGRDVKVERVLAAKGENPVTDYLGFGAVRPEPKSKQWQCYSAFDARVIDAPESAADVRSAVVADYQAALEAEWLKELRDKFRVKINKKTLKKIK